MKRKAKVIFFAGTDTEVGKTHVASMAARFLSRAGVRVGVYKPVASGCEMVDDQLIAEDAVSLWHAAGRPKTLGEVCPQTFIAPLAPPQAAATAGRQVDREHLVSGLKTWISDEFDLCVVEGAGGLMSPIAESMLNRELATTMRPDHVVLVSANRLGTIHQTLATLDAAGLGGLSISGIVLNQPTGVEDPSRASNAEEIARYTDVPLMGQVPFGSDRCPDRFANWLTFIST